MSVETVAWFILGILGFGLGSLFAFWTPATDIFNRLIGKSFLIEENTRLEKVVGSLDKDITQLKETNLKLLDENAQLRAKLSEREEQIRLNDKKLSIHRGIGFRTRDDGSIEPRAYCVDCKVAMAAPGNGGYHCGVCGRSHSIGGPLKDLLDEFEGLGGQSFT